VPVVGGYEEAADYLKQLADRTATRNRGNEGNNGAPEEEQSHESTPEGLTAEEADEFRQH